MWVIPVGIFVIVTLIVFGAALNSMRGGHSFRDVAYMGFGSFLGVYIFSTSFLAFMVTVLSSPTMQDWSTPLAIRVAWQAGGGLFAAGAVLFEARRNGRLDLLSVWILSAVFVIVGCWCALNPALDLIEGPVAFQAVGLDTHDWYNWGKGGGPEINSSLHVRAADGSTRDVDLIGWQANRGEDLLRTCEGATEVTVEVLAHMDEVLDASCQH